MLDRLSCPGQSAWRRCATSSGRPRAGSLGCVLDPIRGDPISPPDRDAGPGREGCMWGTLQARTANRSDASRDSGSTPRSKQQREFVGSRYRVITAAPSGPAARLVSTARSDATWPIGGTAPARKRSCPVGGDSSLPTGSLGLLLSTRMLAVETDHPARGAGTIGFITERSSGGGAPGASSWAKALARSGTPESRKRAPARPRPRGRIQPGADYPGPALPVAAIAANQPSRQQRRRPLPSRESFCRRNLVIRLQQARFGRFS